MFASLNQLLQESALMSKDEHQPLSTFRLYFEEYLPQEEIKSLQWGGDLIHAHQPEERKRNRLLPFLRTLILKSRFFSYDVTSSMKKFSNKQEGGSKFNTVC